jgi:hypothetical protein
MLAPWRIISDAAHGTFVSSKPGQLTAQRLRS